MDINELIQKIQAEFDNIAPGTLKPETKIREIDGWSSMHALIIVALADTEYGVTIKGDELRKTETIQELYDLIVEKQKNPQ
jgi:acyl carrier protein